VVEGVFSEEEIAELEQELTAELKHEGLPVESLQLIGVKGSGSHSTVFSVLIDGHYHVLKVYLEKNALERELKQLRQNIPLDRFFFVWPAHHHRFRYDIVIIEVPEGEAMRSSDLTPKVAAGLAESLIRLHQITSDEIVDQVSIEQRYDEVAEIALVHAKALPDFDEAALKVSLEAGRKFLESHPDLLSVPARQVHGDPWWANIIVAAEEVYLIDWENVKFDDYTEDLAKFRVLMDYIRHELPPTFWDRPSDRELADPFMEQIFSAYDEVFKDPTMRRRFAFYCLYFGVVVFADYYRVHGRSSPKVVPMMLTAMEQFRRYESA
jgi:hypothetical protein